MATEKSATVGTLWAVPGETGARVRVTTPSGEHLTVVAFEGTVLVVLTEPGEWSTGEHTITAKA